MNASLNPASWERLGGFVAVAREQLGLTQKELACEAGVSLRTIQTFETGRYRTRLPVCARYVEDALGWETGSIARILEGGEPTRKTKMRKMSKKERDICRFFLLDAPMPAGTRESLLRLLDQ